MPLRKFEHIKKKVGPVEFAAITPILESSDKIFGKYLDNKDLIEICYNGDYMVWTLDNKGTWKSFSEKDNEVFSVESLTSFARIVASHNNKGVDSVKNTILSGTLFGGERIQIVLPPTTGDEKIISITIRKPSEKVFPHSFFIENGFYDLLANKDEAIELIAKGIQHGKNIVICGGTGSGKTTYMKSLLEFIPKEERIISVEDTKELVFAHHENVVKLYYGQNEHQTPTNCLKSCLRMRPDRILLGEIRGAEAFELLNILQSGHKGSISTLHAGNAEQAFKRLATMSAQNPQAGQTSHRDILMMFQDMIDIIVHINHDRQCDEFYIK